MGRASAQRAALVYFDGTPRKAPNRSPWSSRMLDRRHPVSLTVLFVSLTCAAWCKGDNNPLANAEQTLRQWKVEPTAARVLGYLRSQTLDESARLSLERWILEMGSDRFADRERATERIKALGQPGLP